MKTAKGVMIAVGSFSVLMAAVGLWYNLTTLSTNFADLAQEQNIPYFYPAFYAMSAVCIGCYIVLLTCGIQFIRLRTGLLKLFVGTIIFEVVYFFSIGTTWLVPGIGMSIGAATGVANGWLMFQALILFPLWAPFLARWAAGRLTGTDTASNQASEATSEPALGAGSSSPQG